MAADGTEHVLSEPRLYHVQPHELPRAWPLIEPILAKACEESRGDFSLQRILANLEHWPILVLTRGEKVQAVMVTCVTVKADGKRVLDCLIAGGEDASEWPAVDDDFDAFARALGCEAVRIPFARKGWLKALPHWRLVATGYVLERAI